MGRNTYLAFTLLEMLVVMSIMIILGGLGLSAFGGLRDTVVINQNITDLKQDIKQIQQDAMLIQKAPNEGWVYGIGIDFTKFEAEGTYTYFKWCSGFKDFGDEKTKSEIPGWNSVDTIAVNNGYLPTNNKVKDCTQNGVVGLAPYGGYAPGMITLGFDRTVSIASYVLFESSTGRAFLYDAEGTPVSYFPDGKFNPAVDPLGLSLKRNQGKIIDDILVIMPISGETYKTDSSVYSPADSSAEEGNTPAGPVELGPGDGEVTIENPPGGGTTIPPKGGHTPGITPPPPSTM